VRELDAARPGELVRQRDAAQRSRRVGHREDRRVRGDDRLRCVSYFFTNFATTVLL
jgi:hypothetical protein